MCKSSLCHPHSCLLFYSLNYFTNKERPNLDSTYTSNLSIRTELNYPKSNDSLNKILVKVPHKHTSFINFRFVFFRFFLKQFFELFFFNYVSQSPRPVESRNCPLPAASLRTHIPEATRRFLVRLPTQLRVRVFAILVGRGSHFHWLPVWASGRARRLLTHCFSNNSTSCQCSRLRESESRNGAMSYFDRHAG